MARPSFCESFAVLLLSVAGCTTPEPAQPAIPPLGTGTLLPLRPVTADFFIRPREPYFPWMEINSFFPPGCHRIFPASGYQPPPMTITPSALFPSMTDCPSPNKHWTLHHLGNDGADGIDYVILARRESASESMPKFITRNVLEVLWSPDSTRVAISVLIGGNSSSVVILPIEAKEWSQPIDPSPVLKGYLTNLQIGAPRFLMALRWTPSGKLVLRAQGQEPIPPRTLFGYEVLVDPERLDEPQGMRFLRAYTKAADAPNAGGLGEATPDIASD